MDQIVEGAIIGLLANDLGGLMMKIAGPSADAIGQRIGGESESEAEHFYTCPACGQAVDKRDLGEVFHHEVKGHVPLS